MKTDLKTRVQKLPAAWFRVQLAPESINEAERTVEVVWTVGAKVLRYGYYEKLSLAEGAVILDRLNSGAPALDSHIRNTCGDVKGVIEKAWIKNGEGRAIIRFAKPEDDEVADQIFRKVKDGIVRNVSVGYFRYSMKLVEEIEGDYDTYEVDSWEPFEISFVPVGADPEAGVRSLGEVECTIYGREISGSKGGEAVEKNKQEPATAEKREPTEIQKQPEQSVAQPKVSDEEKRQIAANERARIEEIRVMARASNFDEKEVERLISSETPVEEARKLMMDNLKKKDPEVRSLRIEQSGLNETETTRKSIESALMHRFDPEKFKLEMRGNEFIGQSLNEIAKELLRSQGVDVRTLSKTQIAERTFQSSSEFPGLMANVAQKTLRAGYEMAVQTFRPFTRETFRPDFKKNSILQISDAPSLEKVSEDGEIKRGKFEETNDGYALETFAKIVAITRKVIINDDVDAFTKIPMQYGVAAADLESDLVWNQILGNPKMGYDGVTLFHASHGNLAGSGAAVSVNTIAAARQAMREQTSLKKRKLNINGKYVVGGSARELEILSLLTSISPNQVSSVNPYSNMMMPIIEPRVSGAWFMIADKAQIDTVELAYLQGQRGVVIETKNGFDVDGLEVKALLDVAAKVIDHRGFYKNPGN